MSLDSYTKLLLHGDGVDESTAITDEIGNTVTANGDAQIDTAQKVFGSGSILFSGAGYLEVPDSADWNFGADDFTIDFRVRFSSVAGSQCFVCQGIDKNNRWILDYLVAADTGSVNQLVLYQIVGGSGNIGIRCTWNPVIDTDYHIAVSKSSGVTKLFIDGEEQTLTSNTENTMYDFSTVLTIGSEVDFGLGRGRYLNGWIDEFRISKGIARWTTDFVPPARAYGSARTFNQAFLIYWMAPVPVGGVPAGAILDSDGNPILDSDGNYITED